MAERTSSLFHFNHLILLNFIDCLLLSLQFSPHKTISYTNNLLRDSTHASHGSSIGAILRRF